MGWSDRFGRHDTHLSAAFVSAVITYWQSRFQGGKNRSRH
jgi:hypothetical protein